MTAPLSKKIGKFELFYKNAVEIDLLYKEVFDEEIYRFSSSNPKPVILDCGSHVGLSVLFFKQIFPQAQITAFEADIDNYQLLELNIRHNGLEGVHPFNRALSDQEGIVSFFRKEGEGPRWTWDNTIIKDLWGDGLNRQQVPVPAARLSDYITGEIDFLKIDTEGAESKIMGDIETKLPQIRQLSLEYHGTQATEDENSLDRILETLKRNSFEVNCQKKEFQVLDDGKDTEALKPSLYLINAFRKGM